MSQSPATVVDRDQAQAYITAFNRLAAMAEAGRSFSGNERNCAFLNTTDGRFADISAASGLDFIDDGRAIGQVDWDHDGDLDLWLRNRTSPQLRYMRNDTPHKNHFIAVGLEGRSSNRDAIGTRVEVYLGGDAATPLLKTLRAGDGFLSQSSKWLHFGLGRNDRINKLVVRWPGGTAQAFTNLKVDHHYRIVQGGEAQPWSRPGGRPAPLAASRLDGNPATLAGRVRLAAPPRLPILTYNNFAGREVALTSQIHAPTLVNLWASWCVPCRAELKEWIEHKQMFEKAGLKVIVLSVDGTDKSRDTDDMDTLRALDDPTFPFECGLATTQMLKKLQMLHDRIFGRVVPLAVPTSFLIDPEGRIAAIYRGRVEPKKLLEDLSTLGAKPRRRLDLATPFPNRWLQSQRAMRLNALAGVFRKEGFLEDSYHYLQQAVYFEPGKPKTIGTVLPLQNALAIRIEMGDLLAISGRHAKAVEQYRAALQIDPKSVIAHTMLGRILFELGQMNQALTHLRKAITLAPYNPAAQRLLGVLLSEQGDPAGMDHLNRALKLRPDHALTHYNIGNVLAGQGQMDKAIAHFEKTLELTKTKGNEFLETPARRKLEQLRKTSGQ